MAHKSGCCFAGRKREDSGRATMKCFQAAGHRFFCGPVAVGVGSFALEIAVSRTDQHALPYVPGESGTLHSRELLP